MKGLQIKLKNKIQLFPLMYKGILLGEGVINTNINLDGLSKTTCRNKLSNYSNVKKYVLITSYR